MRTILVALSALVLAASIGGFFWWKWATGAAAPELKNSEKIIVISRGEGVNLIAQRLFEENLIRSSLVFRLLVIKESLAQKIQAGDFRLNPGMTPGEIAQELTHGTLDIWLTIPEGWRREEIGQELNEKLKMKNEKFLEETKNLEGYLFPDSYLVPKDATAGAVLKLFLKNFEKKFTPELQKEAGKQELAARQVLILASIVEREAGGEKDRGIIAGILLKRLQRGWPLQADATLQYAAANAKCKIKNEKCEWWTKNLTKEDLKIKSPYNTYLSPGLPPTPICNPGLASIKAVVYPAQTDFWYYLHDSVGKVRFAKTLEEQQANINRYLANPS
jgi:UPF0755 protein